MPIDEMILNPMLDAFRNMAKECQAAGHSGEQMDRMMAALNRMEQLGQEMDDFVAFSGVMSSEGLQMEFSNAYSQVLASAAQANHGTPESYDDVTLLKSSIDGLKEAIRQLEQAKEDQRAEAAKHAHDKTALEVAENEIAVLNKNDTIIKAIQELITYGESGVNLPTFLRVQMEKGLDKAMEGSTVLREGLVYSQSWAEASKINPFNIKKTNDHLTVFDELAARAPFGVPDSLQVTLAHDKIDHHYLPDIALWDGIESAWERITSLLMTWSYAHMSFADKIFPWNQLADPWPEIQRVKDVYPSEIKGRLRIFKANFGLDFADIFTHPTFVWQVEHFQIGESQIWYELLINDIYPQCKPGQYLTQETIHEVEQLWNGNLMSNPENYKNHDRFVSFFDSVFGAGAYLKKTQDRIDWGIRNAAPWNLEQFRVK